MSARPKNKPKRGAKITVGDLKVDVSADTLEFWEELGTTLGVVARLVRTATRAEIDVTDGLATLLMEIYSTAFTHGAHASRQVKTAALELRPGWSPGAELEAALKTFAAVVGGKTEDLFAHTLANSSETFKKTAQAALREALVTSMKKPQ